MLSHLRHLRLLREAGWCDAATLTDLGEMTARWLEGAVPEQPGYWGGPDPETEPLIPTLALACRRGYVTNGSQPGYDGLAYDQRPARQRAAVDGFAAPRVARWLRSAALAEGLLVVSGVAGWRNRRRGAIPVTEWGGRIHTAFGTVLSRREVAFCFEGCSRDAVDALCRASQVTIVDPEWGPREGLWRLLERIPAP